MTTPDPSPAPTSPARPGESAPGAGVRLGLRANLAQFSLLVAVNALVGGTLGQERTVVPLLAERTFHLAAFSSALTFILAFGAVKAVTNFFAGTLSDRFGRKPVLVAGWLVALPIPPLLIWAPSWRWVVAANVLLGVNQGLTWSTTVIMKIDLAGPARRGLAMGLNEAAGYGAVAITALATGYLAAAYGLRPAPFLLGAAYIALGLGLSAAAVKETRGHARYEAAAHVATADHLGGHLTTGQVAWLTSFSEPALSAASQAGMVNNLNDGVAWGLFPILFASHGLTVSQIGVLAAVYPGVWGAGQLATGALSDRIGRKWLIAAGMGVQAVAIAIVALGVTFTVWAVAAVLLGAGTAMVYPTLLAVVGDVAHPAWRARSVGVYRLWRDGGFAVGALLAGVVADAFGILAAIWVVAALTAASGLVVAIRMYETRHNRALSGARLPAVPVTPKLCIRKASAIGRRPLARLRDGPRLSRRGIERDHGLDAWRPAQYELGRPLRWVAARDKGLHCLGPAAPEKVQVPQCGCEVISPGVHRAEQDLVLQHHAPHEASRVRLDEGLQARDAGEHEDAVGPQHPQHLQGEV